MLYERMKKLVKNDKAVSPVVGVILMVAVTIVLAATIYVWVSHMSSPAAAAPSINLRGTFSSDGKTLTLTVISVQGDARWDDLDIKVPNGLTPKIYKDGTEVTTGMVEAGDYIEINVSSFSGSEITVQIVHVPSNSVIYEDTFIVPSPSPSPTS